MATEKGLDTRTYYLTAVDDKGKPITSCSQDGSGWTSEERLRYDSFVDREYLFVALDEATKEGYTNVVVHHVVIGDELSGDEIRALRRDENASIRQRQREALIDEKGLSPEQVALIAQQ